jgi:hypothetical protein
MNFEIGGSTGSTGSAGNHPRSAHAQGIGQGRVAAQRSRERAGSAVGRELETVRAAKSGSRNRSGSSNRRWRRNPDRRGIRIRLVRECRRDRDRGPIVSHSRRASPGARKKNRYTTSPSVFVACVVPLALSR